jgi:phage tail-like protein
MPPAAIDQFRLSVDGLAAASFSRVSALRRTTDVIEYREGADLAGSRKAPGLTRYEPITLERTWSPCAPPVPAECAARTPRSGGTAGSGL